MGSKLSDPSWLLKPPPQTDCLGVRSRDGAVDLDHVVLRHVPTAVTVLGTVLLHGPDIFLYCRGRQWSSWNVQDYLDSARTWSSLRNNHFLLLGHLLENQENRTRDKVGLLVKR